MTASLRATATVARFRPFLRARRSPHVLSAQDFVIRISNTLDGLIILALDLPHCLPYRVASSSFILGIFDTLLTTSWKLNIGEIIGEEKKASTMADKKTTTHLNPDGSYNEIETTTYSDGSQRISLTALTHIFSC